MRTCARARRYTLERRLKKLCQRVYSRRWKSAERSRRRVSIYANYFRKGLSNQFFIRLFKFSLRYIGIPREYENNHGDLWENFLILKSSHREKTNNFLKSFEKPATTDLSEHGDLKQCSEFKMALRWLSVSFFQSMRSQGFFKNVFWVP